MYIHKNWVQKKQTITVHVYLGELSEWRQLFLLFILKNIWFDVQI